MSTRQRGFIALGIILFVAIVFCGLTPFFWMPGAGIGVALPVITVPGEVVQADFLPGWDLTNSFIGTVLTGLLMLLITAILWRMTKGWTREVPSRLQQIFELFIGTFRNFLKGIAGDKLSTTPLLWPLVATIFFFLLTANYMKLFPGVETVGKMHCTYATFKGYPMIQVNANGYQLWVDSPLNAGKTQTAETYEACKHYFSKEWSRYNFDSSETIEAAITTAQLAVAEAEGVVASAETELASFVATLPAEGEVNEADEEKLHELEEKVAKAVEEHRKAEREVERQEIRLAASNAIFTIDAQLKSVEEELAKLEGVSEEEAHSEGEASATGLAELVLEVRAAANESPYEVSRAELEANVASAFADVQAVSGNKEESITALKALQSELKKLRDFHNTQMYYPTATEVFTQSQLDNPAKPVPFLFHITPFVRGPATDLSLTFMFAIMSMVLVQVYGVWALGPAYFEKFINITALGNLGKRPLGAIDFVVGLIEIISEIGKIVSLSFRLFGNLFAGGVALMAVTFLVALLIPGVIYGLELIIGGVQALVFAVLTVVFSVQAQESHHHDDEHDHAEEHA
ncbi:MAG: F0F1 ATP synthase subunit A [bacterium]|nr:F0F1 ATP synthase subunit A [bacterium]